MTSRRTRVLALILCCIMLTSLIPTAFAASNRNGTLERWNDVESGEYYYAALSWAVGNEITNGISAARFGVAESCTRAQVVTFLWRMAGCPQPSSYRNPFTDIDKNAYYYEAVLWAIEKGIAKGTSATTFSPDGICSRAQIVTFLYRAATAASVYSANPFMDIHTGDYFYEAVLWAVANNVTNGVSNNVFAPDAACTRAQVITFLYRAKDLLGFADDVPNPTLPRVPSAPADPIDPVDPVDPVDPTDPVETVEFKKNGVCLYKLIPETAYPGASSSVNGEKVSDSSRVKVRTSYVDMLFGTENAAGEFTEAITADNAERILLLGTTEDAASRKALEQIKKDEWIICQIDGKLVVTGWFDNATAAAARQLYALAASESNVTLKLPVKGKLSGYSLDVPDCTSGTYAGGFDGDDGTVIFRYTGMNDSDFDTYAQAMLDAGYSLYQEHELASYGNQRNRFKTFVKDDKLVHIYYAPSGLVGADQSDMTNAQKNSANSSFRPDGNELRIIADLVKYAAPNEAANVYVDAGITPKLSVVNLYDKYSDGNDIGQCDIFTLADGSFIIYDGGWTLDAMQVYRALKQLNEREDGKIIIAAWVFTHAHPDHTGAFETLAGLECAKEITLERVVCNPVAKTYNWRSEHDPYGYAFGTTPVLMEANLQPLLDKFGGDTKIIHPHMGQKLCLRNAVIEVLYSADEDLYPVLMNNDNDSSLVTRVHLGGQSTLMLGDAARDTSVCVLMPLFSEVVDSDIIQVAHHGLGGISSKFYYLTAPEIAIWSTTPRTLESHDLMHAVNNLGLQTDKLKLNVIADQYLQTLALPFDPDEDVIIKRVVGRYLESSSDPLNLTAATFDVGTLGRMSSDYLAQAKKEILKTDADVIALNAIEQYTALCGNCDMAATLAEACGYPYYYYAAAWSREAGDLENSDKGTHGNMIMSRYPIEHAERFILVQGANGAEPEGRSAGHCVITVEGTTVDLYFTEFGNSGQWSEFAKIFKPENEHYLVFGTLRCESEESVRSNLNDNQAKVVTMEGGGRDTIVISGKFAVSSHTYTPAPESYPFFGGLVSARLKLLRTPAPPPVESKPTILEWNINDFARDYDEYAPRVAAQIRQSNADIAALIALTGTEEQIDSFAASCGYEHFYFVNAQTRDGKLHGNLLLSKYAFVGTPEAITLVPDQATPDYDSDMEGRAFGHAVVELRGQNVDIYFGETSHKYQKQALWDSLEAAVKETADQSGREFLVLGTLQNTAIGASYAGRNVSTVVESYTNNIIASEGFTLSDKSSTRPVESPFFDNMLCANKYTLQ